MSSAIALDLLIIGVYFAIIVGIGVHFSRRNKNVSEFALGGRSIPWWAVLASILASEISAGTFFGTPGEGFRLRNYTYAQLMVGYLLARLVVSAVFIPAYYKHNVVSIYEFLEMRFGPRTRRIASAVFLLTRSLASGSRLWVPTLLLVVIWNRMNPEQPVGKLAAILVHRRGARDHQPPNSRLHRRRRHQGGDLDGRVADRRACSARWGSRSGIC